MEEVLNIAKALSDGNRLRALMLLRNGELCGCQLINLLKLAPSTVSKHMSILKQASLVETRREGKWTYYRLSDNSSDTVVSEILAWIEKNLDGAQIIAIDKYFLLESAGAENGQCNKTEARKTNVYE